MQRVVTSNIEFIYLVLIYLALKSIYDIIFESTVAAVLLDLVYLSFFTVSSCNHRQNIPTVVRQKSHWIIIINDKRNVWKCKLIFPIDTLLQKYINNW